MTDTTAAPPVSPSEGSPTKPAQEDIDAFLENLEAKIDAEKWHKMSAQVPPSLQADFLKKYPPPPAVTCLPVDEEDIRQAASKRGDPAPNEPKEYTNAVGETIDPTKLPEPAAAPASSAPPAESAPVYDQPQPAV